MTEIQFICSLVCRSVLFRQILPGLESLLTCLKRIAERKGKTMSQVSIAFQEQNDLHNKWFMHRSCQSGFKLSEHFIVWVISLFSSLQYLNASEMQHMKKTDGDSVIWTQVAINWCICKGTIPIPGVKTVRHVEDNLGALGWRLSPAEVSELEAAAMESPKRMVQNIFQTAWAHIYIRIAPTISNSVREN